MTYRVEVFMNETDSIVLVDTLFISFVGNIVKFDRMFDEPIFDMNEIHHIEIKKEDDATSSR